MKMASRSKDLISKKKKQIARVAHFFFLISKKINLHVQHAFCISLPFFAQLQGCFIGVNRIVKLPSYTLFLSRNCRMCLPNL